MVKRYCFVIWQTLLTQLKEKENLFKPNKKAMKSKLHLFYIKTFEVGPVVGNGPTFQFTCMFKQFVLGDVAQEKIRSEPFGPCVYS